MSSLTVSTDLKDLFSMRPFHLSSLHIFQFSFVGGPIVGTFYVFPLFYVLEESLEVIFYICGNSSLLFTFTLSYAFLFYVSSFFS